MERGTPAVIEALRRASGYDGPLPPVPAWPAAPALQATFGLSSFELDLLVLAVLPEVHEAWGDLFARMGAAWRRPTLGMALGVLVPDPEQRARVSPAMGRSRVVQLGLVRLGMPELPEPDRPLRASPAVLAVLQGHAPTTVDGTGPVRPMEVDDGTLLLRSRSSLRELVDHLGDARVVQLRRTDPETGVELAQTLAAHRGLPLLRIHDATSAPEALQDAATLAAGGPYVVLVQAAPDLRHWVLDSAPPAGALVLDPRGGQVEAPASVAVRVIDVPHPSPLEMAELWRSLVPELGEGTALDALANQTRIRLAGMRRAVHDASVAGPPTVDALQRAVSRGRSDPPTTMARVSRPAVPWDALVVPPDVHAQLSELRARVRHRVTVQYRWGLSNETGRGDGVVALLHGDSGVGKTFACEALASTLGLPLVKVDLSRVVSKYIGETEKNLEQVFSMAEGFGYLLLFDEADAVFGKRTGVRDAHDRYANIETNYLLQRLETFEGVAVLSTNLLKNIDDAFLRRLQLVIHLPRPTIPLRQHLWERSLPASVRADDVDCEALARRFDLVGAEIRNAAVRGAYAAAEGGGSLTQAILHDAIRVEFAKKGRPFPAWV